MIVEAERRRAALRAGRLAEAAALLALMLKGWRPLARRYGGKGGEIDLIMARGDTIAFVEVKHRPDFDAAAEAITPGKRRLFSRAARRWLAQNPWAATRTLRADAVLIAPRRWPRHAPCAFTLDLE